jgi:hypothetical protein
MILLFTAEHHFSFNQLNFAITMIHSFVETQFKNYNSLNSQLESLKDFVIYSQLSKYLFIYFKKDVV